jgi:hypothetical protein
MSTENKYSDEWKEHLLEICNKETIAGMLQEVAIEKEEYKKALQYFIGRVEEGSIRSSTTYTMYKELLEKYK